MSGSYLLPLVFVPIEIAIWLPLNSYNCSFGIVGVRSRNLLGHQVTTLNVSSLNCCYILEKNRNNCHWRIVSFEQCNTKRAKEFNKCLGNKTEESFKTIDTHFFHCCDGESYNSWSSVSFLCYYISWSFMKSNMKKKITIA